MKKYISIIMATIIMLTASITASPIYAATPTAITASVKAKSSPHTNKKKKKKHKHSMPKGNMKKWFKSKKALKKLKAAKSPGMNMSAVVLTDTKRGLAPAESGQGTSNTTKSNTLISITT